MKENVQSMITIYFYNVDGKFYGKTVLNNRKLLFFSYSSKAVIKMLSTQTCFWEVRVNLFKLSKLHASKIWWHISFYIFTVLFISILATIEYNFCKIFKYRKMIMFQLTPFWKTILTLYANSKVDLFIICKYVLIWDNCILFETKW